MNFRAEYRIVTDAYCGYEAQAKYWYWPFWHQLGGTNTRPSVQEAEAYILQHLSGRKKQKQKQSIVVEISQDDFLL